MSVFKFLLCVAWRCIRFFISAAMSSLHYVCPHKSCTRTISSDCELQIIYTSHILQYSAALRLFRIKLWNLEYALESSSYKYYNTLWLHTFNFGKVIPSREVLIRKFMASCMCSDLENPETSNLVLYNISHSNVIL